MKLKNLKLHQKIFLFAILINMAIAVLDIYSMKSGIFGTPQDYTHGIFSVCSGCSWWNLFFYFNLASIILISLSYYFFARKDKSETFSLFISSLSLWIVFGLADFLFFVLRLVALPERLPWLDAGIVGKLSSIIGFPQVTNISLIIISLSGLGIVYIINKFLVNKM